ncbi:unnamed protein product [Toxocara canis]|uniref:HECT-type E3 ubiquitin transferase n=1 Tax=Toxocara canis TaxID=6265 RepID=A0A183U7W7_TOXCA|nr:unnamed protein product [Toxocara canis]
MLKRSLQGILDYDKDDLAEVFGLTFVISFSLLGYSKEVDLKENGAEIAVTQENKAEFVKLYVTKRLEEGNDGEIAKQLKSFDEGFRTVIHSRILQFFQPQELMEMVIGNENYDWVVFRKVAFSYSVAQFCFFFTTVEIQMVSLFML